MWIMKLLMKHEGDIFTERTAKFNVDFYGYPLAHYKKGKIRLFSVMGILEGEEEASKQFLKDLKKRAPKEISLL